MARTLMCLAIVVIAVSLAGCPGDRAADRTLTIYQFQDTGTYPGQFQIDVSQLPPDAVETRVDRIEQGVPVTTLTIKQRYSIRVVLMPAEKR